MTKKLILYFDDTGSRDPDNAGFTPTVRDDGMDCFGLGGVLIKEENIDQIFQSHKAFCTDWKIDYPLHSSKIRGGQGKFGWLKKPENAGLFYAALEEFLLSLPITGIACIIHRPGYVARYKDKYQQKLWYMCKTAFSILIERSAKFADTQERKLEVFFEMSGKREDRDIVRYMRELKNAGSPFGQAASKDYTPLLPEDYRRIVLGEPRQKTKSTPMIQIADLVLYPMAKGGYVADYRPYVKLKGAGKLIDSLLPEEQLPFHGIKYSCFDD